MIILLTGGRDFQDEGKIREGLDAVIAAHNLTTENSIWVHGGARGLDSMAGHILSQNGYHTAKCRALWNKHPRSGGTRRNTAMLLLKPDLCVVFPGGAGTRNMRDQAMAANIPTVQVTYAD